MTSIFQNNHKKYKRGFIALISVILISLMLSTYVLTMSILYQNLEEDLYRTLGMMQLHYAAYSCFEIALQKIIEHPDFQLTQPVLYFLPDSLSCSVEHIEKDTISGNFIFITSSSYTKLKTTINKDSFMIETQTEL